MHLLWWAEVSNLALIHLEHGVSISKSILNLKGGAQLECWGERLFFCHNRSGFGPYEPENDLLPSSILCNKWADMRVLTFSHSDLKLPMECLLRCHGCYACHGMSLRQPPPSNLLNNTVTFSNTVTSPWFLLTTTTTTLTLNSCLCLCMHCTEGNFDSLMCLVHVKKFTKKKLDTECCERAERHINRLWQEMSLTVLCFGINTVSPLLCFTWEHHSKR